MKKNKKECFLCGREKTDRAWNEKGRSGDRYYSTCKDCWEFLYAIWTILVPSACYKEVNTLEYLAEHPWLLILKDSYEDIDMEGLMGQQKKIRANRR